MASKKYSYAVWRRKSSTAVVKLFKSWSGKFTVTKANGKQVSLQEYFGGNWYMFDNALRPFLVIDKNFHKGFDAEITIRGGWLAGQSDAIKLGFARSLIIEDEGIRPTLKSAGTLKRDGRIKERKKPGLKKARKAPTWSKR